MSTEMFILYSFTSFMIGLSCALFWLGWRCLPEKRRRRPGWEDIEGFATVGYMGALFQAVSLRLGLESIRFFHSEVRLRPLLTTIEQFHNGSRAFTYHVLGNTVMFAPVGVYVFYKKKGARWYHALAAGLGVSMVLEGFQFLLGTGIFDIDDLMLNCLGSLIGYGIFTLMYRA